MYVLVIPPQQVAIRNSKHCLHDLTTGYKTNLGKGASLVYLAHMHNFLILLFCCSIILCFLVSPIYNLLSVSMTVMSIVSRRISPIGEVNCGVNLRRTVLFGSWAMLSLVKVTWTIAGANGVTRTDVGATWKSLLSETQTITFDFEEGGIFTINIWHSQ